MFRQLAIWRQFGEPENVLFGGSWVSFFKNHKKGQKEQSGLYETETPVDWLRVKMLTNAWNPPEPWLTHRVLAENAGEPVTETPGSYCMLDYSTGRLGPIDDYADLACRTGGNYIYVPGIEEMRPPLRSLPSVIDGQWSIESEISYLDTSQGTEPGYYRLSGVILGVFGNYSVGSRLTAPIIDEENPNFATVENRPVVRVGRTTN